MMSERASPTTASARDETPARAATAVGVTGAVLLLLWGASFALSYVDAGPFALALALGIAVVKAAIVMVVFMEFWRSPLSVKLAFFAAIALLATLMSLMIADVETREPEPALEGPRSARTGPPS